MVVTIAEALEELEQVDPRGAKVVKTRHFTSLSVDETTAALGVAARTVDTQWRYSRIWLHRELSKGSTT